MTVQNKSLTCAVTEFKYDEETGVFECYGNTKGNIDHAKDRTMDGAYQKSIEQHKANGTMPNMFWAHNPHELPVGKWLDMREDAKGLWMKGKLSKTTMGSDIEILAKDGALDSFSIGYSVGEERWNAEKGCNDLLEIKIIETSWVNRPCNEESRLIGIKSMLDNNELPTKRDLEKMLREQGLSKKQAEKIASKYDPTPEPDCVFAAMSKLS